MLNVLSDKYPGNNIPKVTGWVNKVDKCNYGSTTISVKFDVDGFIYHNIILKDATKVGILNRMHSKPLKIENIDTTS